jgi:uncharacterized repeat protein (TIGR01451 family)
MEKAEMIRFMKRSIWEVVVLIALFVIAFLGFVLATQKATAFHGVGVLKSSDAFAYVNETITYQIKVYNPSDFDLYNINVTDDLLGFNETIPFMAAGNETGVTYNLKRKVLETDPNPLVNTVNVEAIDSDGVYSTASTQAKTTILVRLIKLEKMGPEFAHEGDTIKYTIVITSLADSPITDVTVQDEVLGFGWQGDLSAGESDTFNLTYCVPTGAEDPLMNKVTAFAKVDNSTVYAEASWSVDILHPKLEVNKKVTPTKVCLGDNFTYTISVTNAGDAELFNLTLTDSIYGPAPNEIIPTSLKPNESFEWSFNATLNEWGCWVRNVATASGVDILGKNVTASSSAIVFIKPPFYPRGIGYWKTHPKAWPVDQIGIGNLAYTKEEALSILWEASAKDATKMLAAQLIAAKLNRLSGACPNFTYCGKSVNIDDTIEEADDFLIEFPIGSDPKGDDRLTALYLKSILDAYNNLRCICTCN